MLSIGKLSVGQLNYYRRMEDYYSLGQNAPSSWWGKGAETLGIAGEQGDSRSRRLFAGFDLDKTPLVQNAGDKGRCPGVDLVFSTDKTFDICWALARRESDREDLVCCHQDGVRHVLEKLASEGAFTRLGKGGKELMKAEIAVLLYEHQTSREQDPKIHTHCLLANLNLAVKPNGLRGGALDLGGILALKMELGLAYRQRLAENLERLGYPIEWYGRRNEFCRIAGVPRCVVEEFSKRRAQIKQALSKDGQTNSAKAAEVACKKTRRKKQTPVSRKELFADWKQRAARHAFYAEDVERLRQGGPTLGRRIRKLVAHNLSPTRLLRQAGKNILDAPRSVWECGLKNKALRAKLGDQLQGEFADRKLQPKLKLGQVTTKALVRMVRRNLDVTRFPRFIKKNLSAKEICRFVLNYGIQNKRLNRPLAWELNQGPKQSL